MSDTTQVSTTGESFLVVLKVRGDGIHLRQHNDIQPLIGVSHSLKILCHDLGKNSAKLGSGVKVFVLGESESLSERSEFQVQDPQGHSLEQSDLAIFMTSPQPSTKKASYSITLATSKLNSSLEDINADDCKKIGTAYLYLDPKFSSQGVQRLQIIDVHNSAPIGQIQIEYLIVTNPAAFGIQVPHPKWLSRDVQLDIGHRGAGSGCRSDLPEPMIENTVASFNYASRHGADMCELDVMCTVDGVPVVYHNYSLNTSGPNTTQIDQITLSELQKMNAPDIHDKNCNHDSSQSNDVDRSSRLFPTLKEVLEEVDQCCALNIELKWPQMLPNGKSEAAHYREINDFVDRVLDCMNTHSNGRPILLSTLNSDIAILLRLKQIQYPVLFLTTGDCLRFHDPATKTVENAIRFARAFDMAGINPNAAKLTKNLVSSAQDSGLLVYVWGKIETAETIKNLKKTGLNGVIYDKIDLIKPQD